jgi:TATA-box binding protein (TBP) (component of TFIID and TFIIIB)
MMEKGMFVICGNSIEELERDLEAMKMVVASGKICGIGGGSIEEVEQAMEMMEDFLEEEEEEFEPTDPVFEMLLEELRKSVR